MNASAACVEHQGAWAPPVGLFEEPPPPAASEPPLAPLSPVPPLAPELASGVLVFSAELPELVVLSLLVLPDAPALEGSSLEVPAAPVDELEPLLEVVATVDVEVVGVASLSAWVLVGGVISGVLCGGTSAELLLPPHAASVRPTRSAAAPARMGASDRSRETPPFGGNPRFDQRALTSGASWKFVDGLASENQVRPGRREPQ